MTNSRTERRSTNSASAAETRARPHTRAHDARTFPGEGAGVVVVPAVRPADRRPDRFPDGRNGGPLSGWCRTSCGICSSAWCRRRHHGRRVAVGAGMATGRCWPRSCSWPRQDARGSSCLPRRSGRRERRPTGAASEWTKARVWAKLHRLVLDELGSRGELDWTRCAIDSVNMRALKRGT